MSEQERVRVDVSHVRCPFCHDALTPTQEKTGCEVCMAWHHRDCWDQHGGCSSCPGLASPAPIRRREPRNIFRVCLRPGCEELNLDPGGYCPEHEQEAREIALSDHKAAIMTVAIVAFVIGFACLAFSA